MKSPEQDDDDWFEILAGRNPPNADPMIRFEAEALRSAVLKKAAEDMPDQPMDFEQFMGRINDDLARQSEVIQASHKTNPNKKRHWWNWSDWGRQQWLPIGVMATLILAFGIIYRLLPEQKIEQATFLGSGEFVLQADDPIAKAKEITKECKAVDIDCAISKADNKDHVIITISLPVKPKPQSADFLRRYQIVLPTDNAPIKLEIRPIKE